MRFESIEQLEQFEFKWKWIFTLFAFVFAGALMDHMVRSPVGQEAYWCYSLGTAAFIGSIVAARKLRDAARETNVRAGLELLEEDLSIGSDD